MQRESQRQTRSLDNVVENPDSWRFLEKKNTSNNLYINKGTTVVNGSKSSNNHSGTIEK